MNSDPLFLIYWKMVTGPFILIFIPAASVLVLSSTYFIIHILEIGTTAIAMKRIHAAFEYICKQVMRPVDFVVYGFFDLLLGKSTVSGDKP